MDENNPSGMESCCTPSRGRDATESGAGPTRPPVGESEPARGAGHTIQQALVPAQVFRMGNEGPDARREDGEGPVHEVELDAFTIDATTVTNGDFARFVADTGYRTEAEAFGFSAVFHLAFRGDRAAIMSQAAGTPWWYGVLGADWAHPDGPDTDLEGRGDHPVVHVSWNDAVAYCRWAGRRLPTEAEWECASRGGRDGQRYPWGDRLGDTWRCNIWQGEFPGVNTMADGWLTTAPAREFEPNDYGIWQSIGNVWEWCADWWDPRYYGASPRRNPPGPAGGTARVLRGGSYLCHDSYCNRYRNAARSSNTPDSSMGNAGFRTVAL